MYMNLMLAVKIPFQSRKTFARPGRARRVLIQSGNQIPARRSRRTRDHSLRRRTRLTRRTRICPRHLMDNNNCSDLASLLIRDDWQSGCHILFWNMLTSINLLLWSKATYEQFFRSSVAPKKEFESSFGFLYCID